MNNGANEVFNHVVIVFYVLHDHGTQAEVLHDYNYIT